MVIYSALLFTATFRDHTTAEFKTWTHAFKILGLEAKPRKHLKAWRTVLQTYFSGNQGLSTMKPLMST